MRKYFSFLLMILILAGCQDDKKDQSKTSQEPLKPGIRFFEGSWSEALAASKAENKPIFMDVYATWCKPCKIMEQDVFTQPEVGSYYNTNFINYRVDGEKGEGRKLAQQFKVEAFPTLLYIDSDGNLMHKVVGMRNKDQFLEDGKTAPGIQNKLGEYEAQFDANNSSPEFMREYLGLLLKTGNYKEEVREAYFRTQEEDSLLNPENKKLLMELGPLSQLSIDNREGEYLLTHRAAMEERWGREESEYLYNFVVLTSAQQAAMTKNTQQFYKLKQLVKKHALEPERSVLALEFTYAELVQDWPTHINKIDEYLRKFSWEDANLLNNSAWNVFSRFQEDAFMETALSWTERSIELQPAHFNYDTKANLLFRLKRYAEAEQAALKAIELAAQGGQNAMATHQLLTLIRQNLN